MILATASKFAGPIKEPLEVHLTSSGAAPLEFLGPVAIVVAALGGAWFAARYARDNTKQELAAAERRLDKQATRTTIDGVVATMTEVLDSAADLAVAIRRREALEANVGAAPSDSHEREVAEEKYDDFVHGELERFTTKAFEAHIRISPTKLRLRLRFAPDDPVLTSFDRWQSTMSLARERVRKGLHQARTDSELHESQEIETQIPISLEEFVSAVRTWILGEESE